MSKKTLPPHYADQHNRNNVAYWKGRGYEDRPADWASSNATHQPSPASPAKESDAPAPDKR